MCLVYNLKILIWNKDTIKQCKMWKYSVKELICELTIQNKWFFCFEIYVLKWNVLNFEILLIELKNVHFFILFNLIILIGKKLLFVYTLKNLKNTNIHCSSITINHTSSIDQWQGDTWFYILSLTQYKKNTINHSVL